MAVNEDVQKNVSFSATPPYLCTSYTDPLVQLVQKNFSYEQNFNTKYINIYSSQLIWSVLRTCIYAIITHVPDRHTVVHGSIQQVGVVPISCVPTIQGEGRETSCLCVCIHALNDQHMLLQSLTPVGLPFRHKHTSSTEAVQVPGRRCETSIPWCSIVHATT